MSLTFNVKPGSLQEHQLLEVAKRLNLKPIMESAEVDSIWKRLLAYKADLAADNPCEITPEDEKTLKADIERKLKNGWPKNEIYSYLKWTEYFDDYTHTEEECLRKMTEISNRVEGKTRQNDYL
jgi:hypothetical protein